MKEIIYELAFLLSGGLDETKAQEAFQKIEKMLSELGQVKLSLEPKKIKLAYPVKKEQEGFLVSIDFTTKPENIAVVSQTMDKSADILRFLIIKKSPEKIKAERPEGPLPQKVQAEETSQEIPKPKQLTPEEINSKKAQGEQEEKPLPQKVQAEGKKEKSKKERPSEEEKKEDLKKIEKDLDEILGQ
ncbi:MAG: 30S ribosomal protein S6 [Candidatus Pacebacteria bacterium]|nr:30S ribosomal protein S6 [Candidatus Paceibacterota bacterium]